MKLEGNYKQTGDEMCVYRCLKEWEFSSIFRSSRKNTSSCCGIVLLVLNNEAQKSHFLWLIEMVKDS